MVVMSLAKVKSKITALSNTWCSILTDGKSNEVNLEHRVIRDQVKGKGCKIGFGKQFRILPDSLKQTVVAGMNMLLC